MVNKIRSKLQLISFYQRLTVLTLTGPHHCRLVPSEDHFVFGSSSGLLSNYSGEVNKYLVSFRILLKKEIVSEVLLSTQSHINSQFASNKIIRLRSFSAREMVIGGRDGL